MINLPKNVKIGKLKKENMNFDEDLSFLCPIFPEDIPKVFKEDFKKKEEKKEGLTDVEVEREFKINMNVIVTMKFIYKDSKFSFIFKNKIKYIILLFPFF